MNCANRMYMFNEVPAYEASKGERIIKAFEKLKSRIERLEQMRLLEKSCRSEKPLTSNEDLTMSDIKYEMLLTQLHYMIKLAREYPSYSVNAEKHIDNVQTDIRVPCTVAHKKNVVDDIRNDNKDTSTADVKYVLSNVKVKNLPSKSKSQNHYHMKLDDVPFLLGASSSASHSVVANVQNIIALMKGHNKALCSSKSNSQSDVQVKAVKNADSQDPNKMLQELTEDLTNLTKKQEKLKVILDNAQSTHNERHTGAEKKRAICGGSKAKIPNQDKPAPANHVTGESPIVPVVRKQGDTQLARRRFLQSLRDLKTHLSEEDLLWK